MNIVGKLFPLVAFMLLIGPHGASAREVQMLDFAAMPQSVVPVGSDRGATSVDQGPERRTSPSANIDPPQVYVPGWMRRPSAATPAATLPIVPVSSLNGCEQTIYRPNARLSMEAERRRAQYYPLVMAIACEAGIPGHLFDALISQESRYNPSAYSPKGAAGLTQLMPDTAAGLGVLNRFDVVQNLRGGARYLRVQLDEFGRYDLALGAYNAGPGRVRQYKSLPPFHETLQYVRTILSDVRMALFGAIPYPMAKQPVPLRAASLMDF